MKKLLAITTIILGFSAQSYAVSMQITELECNDRGVLVDAGIMIRLNQIHPNPHANKEVEVYSITMAGQELIKNISVQDRMDHRLGSSRVLIGKNFRLVIKPTVTPVSGQMPAHLTAIIDDQKYSLQMLCYYTRNI